MQETCQCNAVYISVRDVKLRLSLPQVPDEFETEKGCTNAVEKPIVRCTWIHMRRHGQLLHKAQPLEQPRINKALDQAWQVYSSMDSILNAECILH